MQAYQNRNKVPFGSNLLSREIFEFTNYAVFALGTFKALNRRCKELSNKQEFKGGFIPRWNSVPFRSATISRELFEFIDYAVSALRKFERINRKCRELSVKDEFKVGFVGRFGYRRHTI